MTRLEATPATSPAAGMLPAPALPGAAPMSTPADWPEALRHLRARAASGSGMDFVGGPSDSITEGLGATSRERSWWSIFSSTMATWLGQPSRAIGSTEISLQSEWSIWSSRGAQPLEGHHCLGKYGLLLRPGTVVSTTQAFDRLQLLYARFTRMFGFEGGELEIRMDGEVIDRLDCSGADVFGNLWDSGPLGEFRPRRLELECVGGGVAPAGHVYFHDGFDPATDARFWRHGRRQHYVGVGMFGFSNELSTHMGAFTTNPLGWNQENATMAFGAGTVEADCFLVSCGTNDIKYCDNDRERLVQTYTQAFEYLRERHDSEASIGLIVPTASTRCNGDYTNLFEAAHRACEQNDAFLIDLWHGLGSHADDRFGYFSDGYHPNDRGHAAWADYVATWMFAAIEPWLPAPADRPASSDDDRPADVAPSGH